MDVRACFSMLMNLVLALMFDSEPRLCTFMSTRVRSIILTGSCVLHFPHHHEDSASKSQEFQTLDPDDDAVFPWKVCL